MNSITTIIKKFDINPCTLSHQEAREYMFYLQEQTRLLEKKELSKKEQKQRDELLERLKIVEIFYDATKKDDECPWLEFEKLIYRNQNQPQMMEVDELTVLLYYLNRKRKQEPELAKTMVQVRSLLKAVRC